MEFSKVIKDVAIEHVRDVDNGRAQYRVKYFGGAFSFFAKFDTRLLGRHEQVEVTCRMWAPGKFALGVRLPD